MFRNYLDENYQLRVFDYNFIFYEFFSPNLSVFSLSPPSSQTHFSSLPPPLSIVVPITAVITGCSAHLHRCHLHCPSPPLPSSLPISLSFSPFLPNPLLIPASSITAHRRFLSLTCLPSLLLTLSLSLFLFRCRSTFKERGNLTLNENDEPSEFIFNENGDE